MTVYFAVLAASVAAPVVGYVAFQVGRRVGLGEARRKVEESEREAAVTALAGGDTTQFSHVHILCPHCDYRYIVAP